jgi:hypothetical protein
MRYKAPHEKSARINTRQSPLWLSLEPGVRKRRDVLHVRAFQMDGAKQINFGV